MNVTIPSSLSSSLRGSVGLVTNANPGSSPVNAEQTAPLTVRQVFSAPGVPHGTPGARQGS